MHLRHRSLACVALAVTLFLAAPSAQQTAAPKITSPKTFFGHDIGALLDLLELDGSSGVDQP